MRGNIMDVPLTLPHLIERAARYFPDKEVVSVAADGTVARMGWGEVRTRVARLARALMALGVRPGDRVATLAWNTHRHLELYFAVPAVGAVLHTINARLSPEQVARIVAHAGDHFVFADPELAPLLEGVEGPEARIAVDGPAPAPGWLDYEALLAGAESLGAFPELSETGAAALCYTSGTTGEPKGVLYSHRALVLHTFAISLPNGFGLGEADTILPAVPMFHANAWGLPFAAAMSGATLVLPGPRPVPGLIARLLGEEAVTFAAGVPTVWLDVLGALEAKPRSLAPGLRIHSGGAPSPPGLIRDWAARGVEVLTGWGMTELSPVGMVCHPRAAMAGWDADQLLPVRTSQGTPLPFVDIRLVDEEGQEVPADGVTPGELEVRGPWVASEYFAGAGGDRSAPAGPDPASFRDGWLRTGDVATLDGAGYVRLVDRTKDLIRSGGEWISSVQLENTLMDHPAVSEAAVVAVPDPRWQERPMAFVVLREDASPDDAAVSALLEGLREHFPSWWIPDRVELVPAIPRTSTGKFDKKALRRLAATILG